MRMPVFHVYCHSGWSHCSIHVDCGTMRLANSPCIRSGWPSIPNSWCSCACWRRAMRGPCATALCAKWNSRPRWCAACNGRVSNGRRFSCRHLSRTGSSPCCPNCHRRPCRHAGVRCHRCCCCHDRGFQCCIPRTPIWRKSMRYAALWTTSSPPRCVFAIFPVCKEEPKMFFFY